MIRKTGNNQKLKKNETSKKACNWLVTLFSTFGKDLPSRKSPRHSKERFQVRNINILIKI